MVLRRCRVSKCFMAKYGYVLCHACGQSRNMICVLPCTQYLYHDSFIKITFNFLDTEIWADIKSANSFWFHDGGDEVTYDWIPNAFISGDGPCIEFTYFQENERVSFNDLSCSHDRIYICQFLTISSKYKP